MLWNHSNPTSSSEEKVYSVLSSAKLVISKSPIPNNKSWMHTLIIIELILNLMEHQEKCHQNYCKNHSPFFFVSFFQSKMLKSIENLNLRHMRLVLQLTTDDWYNQKSSPTGEVCRKDTVMSTSIKMFPPFFNHMY